MTDDQLAAYRATAELRRSEEAGLRSQRLERAWQAAHEGGRILRECFGASGVIVFGSLHDEEWFGPTSDIDLAASGLRSEDYFAAVAAVQGLLREFEVDLVDLDRCPPTLREAVLSSGVAL